MGREDVVSNEYLGSPERVADLLNGYVYHGEGRISAGEVKELRNVFNRVKCDVEDGAESHGAEHGAKQRVRRGGRSSGRRSSGVQTVTADIVREVGEDVKAMIVAIEDQTAIHYAMPVRMMNLEAVGYHTQWRQAAGAHKARKDLAGAEYVGQIVGPQGDSPEINIDKERVVKEHTGYQEDSYSIEEEDLIPGYYVEGFSTDVFLGTYYDDVYSDKYCLTTNNSNNCNFFSFINVKPP